MGLLYYLRVGGGNGCRVKYFRVVSGFDVEFALGLEDIKSVEVVLCEAGRFHPIGEHGDENYFEDLKLPPL